MVVSAHRPERLLRYFECDDVESDEFTSFECRVYTVPKPRWKDDGGGGIGGAGRDDDDYDDVLDLDGCYFVYVCVRDPVRARDLEARKEAERRRKDRMGTVPLS